MGENPPKPTPDHNETQQAILEREAAMAQIKGHPEWSPEDVGRFVKTGSTNAPPPAMEAPISLGDALKLASPMGGFQAPADLSQFNPPAEPQAAPKGIRVRNKKTGQMGTQMQDGSVIPDP